MLSLNKLIFNQRNICNFVTIFILSVLLTTYYIYCIFQGAVSPYNVQGRKVGKVMGWEGRVVKVKGSREGNGGDNWGRCEMK